ncbi:hypothetical protein GCM10023192_55830 [Amycolatopsis samaneae]
MIECPPRSPGTTPGLVLDQRRWIAETVRQKRNSERERDAYPRWASPFRGHVPEPIRHDAEPRLLLDRSPALGTTSRAIGMPGHPLPKNGNRLLTWANGSG